MDYTGDVDIFLQEIERKYSPHITAGAVAFDTDDEKQLYTLSQEFESLGLPPISLKQDTSSSLIQGIINNTFLLIHMYRKTLLQITDINVTHKSKDVRILELEKNVITLKMKLKTVEDQNLKLERKLSKLNSECEKLNKTISMHNRETDKMKHFFKSKQNEMIHQVNSLQNENHHLKEMCGKDIDKYFSKEDKFLKILKSYKHNEDIYKNALQKLEENNVEIMNEILDLKRELALAYLKKT